VKIVVGLGNPGSQYEKTRHNIGWMVLDRLADRAGWSGRGRNRDASAIVQGRYNGLDITLAKPLTFMNESGLAVRKVLARERAPLAEMLVVVDDFALPFGKLRFREGGSAGGHNGLRSIIGEMGTEDFARLRVGIGSPKEGAVEHVLGGFEHAEQRHLDAILDAAVDAAELWAREGAHQAANHWNAWQLEVLVDGVSDVASGDPAASGVRSDPSPAAAVPDQAGIVRTTTGWRRLLPGGDRGQGTRS